jgi:hypothetical protein
MKQPRGVLRAFAGEGDLRASVPGFPELFCNSRVFVTKQTLLSSLDRAGANNRVQAIHFRNCVNK